MTYWLSIVQSGDTNCPEDSDVSFRASVPSILLTQRLIAPSRSLVKASHWPSGETRGWLSYASPPKIRSALPPEMGNL